MNSLAHRAAVRRAGDDTVLTVGTATGQKRYNRRRGRQYTTNTHRPSHSVPPVPVTDHAMVKMPPPYAIREQDSVYTTAWVCGWELRGHAGVPPPPSGHPPGSQARGRDALRTLFRAAPALGIAVVRRDHLLFAPQVHNQGLATSISILVKPMGQKGRELPSQVAGGYTSGRCVGWGAGAQ